MQHLTLERRLSLFVFFRESSKIHDGVCSERCSLLQPSEGQASQPCSVLEKKESTLILISWSTLRMSLIFQYFSRRFFSAFPFSRRTLALFNHFVVIGHWWPIIFCFLYFLINYWSYLHFVVSVRLHLTQNVILSLLLNVVPLICIYKYALYCHTKLFFLTLSTIIEHDHLSFLFP